MNRSQINRCVAEAKDFFAKHGFALPPFAFWTPSQWQKIGHEADEIRTRKLGWDVTDFGSGKFLEQGLLLFTLRNGLLGDPNNKKVYAEKIMVVRERQVTPWHFHFVKTEDIINRAGGKLVCELYNSTPEGALADTPVYVACDGVLVELPPGGKITLSPGQSITLTPGLYHTFYGEKGAGPVMVGEVSSVNDDATDNRFLKPLPRFPAVEEDEAPALLLCNEYPAAKNGPKCCGS
jgi:D-lyxose ketol-isomerase